MADSDAVALAVRAAFDQTPEGFISGRHKESDNSLHPREADFVGEGGLAAVLAVLVGGPRGAWDGVGLG